jgi:hypothetical protein
MEDFTLEDLLIQMGINAVELAIKDLNHAAKLKQQLLKVASDIQIAYGLKPPSQS